MKLPNGEHAVVPDAKIVDYLLSNSHRDGQHKARFFRRFGYDLSAWQRLRDDLLEHAKYDVIAEQQSPFGTRYIIEGIIQAPDGRTPNIRTIWFVEKWDRGSKTRDRLSRVTHDPRTRYRGTDC
jgi:hypothetical protein